MDLVNFKRNQVVFREADPAEYVYIVKSGQFNVKKQTFAPRVSEMEYENSLLKG